MSNARVTGLRNVELGVADLDRSAAFYREVWGLEDVLSTGDTIHMRGTGAEHHVLTLRARPKAIFLGVHFAAANNAAVNKLHDQAKAHGATITAAPASAAARGRRRLRLRDALARRPADLRLVRRRPA